MNSFYTQKELIEIGLKSFGENCLISRKLSIYSPHQIEIGDNVRIDDFCILSGKINIGCNVHISAGCYLFAGNEGIDIKDNSSISSRCSIYAITDDYSGNYYTNPTVHNSLRNVIEKKVIINKHVVIGTGSTVLPGVQIGEGCSFGAMSLIRESTKPWGIYVGIPCKRIKERSKKLLDLKH